MASLPLLAHARGEAVFAYRGDAPVRVDRFLRDVEHVARALPESPYLLNACADRYRFCVGFAAALTRGLATLLPPNQTPDLLARLRASYGDVHVLTDTGEAAPPLPTLPFPALGEAEGTAPAMPSIPASRLAAIVFTSGSTGEPVPHAKSWATLVASGTAEAVRLGLHDRSMSVLGTIPAQHMYGLESTVLMPMHSGGAIVAGRPFYPADICDALERLPRPRTLVTTPVHLRALMAEGGPYPALDLVICATSPLAPQLAALTETKLAAPLHEIYGCTEAGQVATRHTVATAEWTALPGMRLTQDEKGTWIRGGHVSDAVLLNDVIEMRGPDRFLLHGRNADLVNIAGKRTSLAHLNHHLNSIDGVLDGVFICPDEEADAVPRLMAFVVAPGLGHEALMDALRARIDAAFLPRPLTFVAALPRSATGKLPRAAMQPLMTEAAGRDTR